jgi:ubiquinone/menaquinone biosynthesis C-methylase UbiE
MKGDLNMPHSEARPAADDEARGQWDAPRSQPAAGVPAMRSGRIAAPGAVPGPRSGDIPDYLRDTYAWAYLTPFFAKVLDSQAVVTTILWGNAVRLIARVLAEIQSGWHVLQPAAVYGAFSRRLAQALGPDGRLTVSDIAPLQVALTRRKLADLPWAQVELCDAAQPGRGPYDAVTCFFLLHEVPESMKERIVGALLGAVRLGGKVVFVDYHRPHPAHPLRPVMGLVFARLEPYARALWTHSIADYAGRGAAAFEWRKHTLFGGLYQLVVATRRTD